jgi:hypothetical protein
MAAQPIVIAILNIWPLAILWGVHRTVNGRPHSLHVAGQPRLPLDPSLRGPILVMPNITYLPGILQMRL